MVAYQGVEFIGAVIRLDRGKQCDAYQAYNNGPQRNPATRALLVKVYLLKATRECALALLARVVWLESG